jgi:hypothetical protein
MRVTLAPGVSFDAYNLHADAGTTAADLVARAANLRQVSDYVKTHSIGNAVLIFGDTNTRYTRGPDDIPGIFAAENGMKDVWVELIKNGVAPVGGSDALLCTNPEKGTACETVDKVFYRGSYAVDIQANSFAYAGDMFLQPNGSILSDHNPVLVDYAWSQKAEFSVSDTFGGDEGTWYNDLQTLGAAGLSGAAVSSVTLRGAERLDNIALTLATGQTLSHGGSGGSPTTLALQSGEKLVGATMCRGDKNGKTRVVYAELKTSTGRSVKAGTKSSDCADMTAPASRGIIGFVGRSGDEVDMMGFVYGKA